jgi:hypothetical protein
MIYPLQFSVTLTCSIANYQQASVTLASLVTLYRRCQGSRDRGGGVMYNSNRRVRNLHFNINRLRNIHLDSPEC